MILKYLKEKTVRGTYKTVLAAVLIAAIGTTVPSYAAVSQLGDSDIPNQFDSENVINCLDISVWQKDISEKDWEKIHASGVDAVMIRAGYSKLDSGTHATDEQFKSYIEGARKEGLEIGVYYFSTALSGGEAVSEAQYLLDIIEPYKNHITLPVAFDFESNEKGRLTAGTIRELGVEGCTNICEEFCDTVAEGGYEPMVYASRTIFDNYLDKERIEKKYKVWLAQYPENSNATGYEGDMYMWQYSSDVHIDGIEGRVDANYIFKDEDECSSKNTITDINIEENANTIINAPENVDIKVLQDSTEEKTQLRIQDSSGYRHSYVIYDSAPNNEISILTTLLNGYFVSKNPIDPEYVTKKVIPATLDDYDPTCNLSMTGIYEVLTKLKLKAEYRFEDDQVYVTIKKHLAAGKPVIISVGKGGEWCKGSQTLLLVGMDDKGKGILVDHTDKCKLKRVSINEIIKKMPRECDKKTGYTYIQQGGYILVDIDFE